MEKQKPPLYSNAYDRLITHIKIVSAKKQKGTNFLNSEYMLYTFK